MPIIKLDISDDLAEKLEADVLTRGTSRKIRLTEIVRDYYNHDLFNFSSPSLGLDNYQTMSAELLTKEPPVSDLLEQQLRHKDELLKIKDEEIKKLTADIEWLKHEYTLRTEKALPAAELFMKCMAMHEQQLQSSFWVRIKRFFGIGKKEQDVFDEFGAPP